MTYQATICKLTELRKPENANRLQIANALGYHVVVGLDVTEDTLGVVFPSDGRLSHEMLLNNNLYRKDPVTGIPLGGYFESNGRVKSLRLLKGTLTSEAFWTPVTALSWTGVDLNELEEGSQFDTLNGHKVCAKYYTPATLKAMNKFQKAGKKTVKPSDFAPDFKKHFSTPKLREVVQFLVGREKPYDFIVTEKLHGTSGRTGLVKWEKKKWYQKALSWVGLYKDSFAYLTGTRRVLTLYPGNYKREEKETGFYSGTRFRKDIHDLFVKKGLKENEIVYYEIVGYAETGKPIMGSHSLAKKSIKESGIPKSEYKNYPTEMFYSYGCEPGEYDVYVYRIVQDGQDLSNGEMVDRAEELGFKAPPFLGYLFVEPEDTVDTIMTKVERFTRGSSELDVRHIKEGVALRLDDDEGVRIFKYKGFMFCALEGIRKNSDDYVDLEEIS